MPERLWGGEKLDIDQTTVARRLNRLERQLGGSLFHTGGDHRHPTPLGQKNLRLWC